MAHMRQTGWTGQSPAPSCACLCMVVPLLESRSRSRGWREWVGKWVGGWVLLPSRTFLLGLCATLPSSFTAAACLALCVPLSALFA